MVNENIKRTVLKLKNPKVLIAVGFIGIFLIFISSVIPKKENKKTEVTAEDSISTEEYRELIKEGVRSIVESITGDSNATVVVTLDSSVKYSYADSKQSDLSSTSGSNTEQSSESVSQSYITVKDSNGGEKPLVITELMPNIRGVAVICRNGDDESVAEKIEGAITAALNITSKRVYITGGNTYEKR